MRYFTSVVVLQLAVNFAKSSFPQTRNNTAASLYNPITQKCCLGKVHPSIKSDSQKCCGSNVYDSTKQLCCNGIVLELAPALGCCGNSTINTDESICCGDQKVDIPQKDASLISYAKCCGQNSYYDYRTQTCCRTESGIKILDGADKKCCGEVAYNETNQVCCVSFKKDTTSYKILPKEGEKTSCCGDSLFDIYSEYCCNEKVSKLDGCCGNQSFNTSTQICCNDQDILEKNGKNMFCCGDEAYSDDTHLCGYNETVDYLVVIPKTAPEQTSSCGLEPYEWEKQICCYDTKKLVTIKQKGDNDCCGGSSFNSKTQQCCGGKPIDLYTEFCCGGIEIYDRETKICCTEDSENGTLEFRTIDDPEFKLSCCGLEANDTSKKMCCGTNLFPLSGNGRCCRDRAYDFTKEVCCSETVFTKESGQDACCLYGTTDAKPICMQ